MDKCKGDFLTLCPRSTGSRLWKCRRGISEVGLLRCPFPPSTCINLNSMSSYWPARFPTRRLIVLLYGDRDRSSAAYRKFEMIILARLPVHTVAKALHTYKHLEVVGGGKCSQRCHLKKFLQVLEFH